MDEPPLSTRRGRRASRAGGLPRARELLQDEPSFSGGRPAPALGAAPEKGWERPLGRAIGVPGRERALRRRRPARIGAGDARPAPPFRPLGLLRRGEARRSLTGAGRFFVASLLGMTGSDAIISPDMIPVWEPVLDGNEERYVLDCLETNW